MRESLPRDSYQVGPVPRAVLTCLSSGRCHVCSGQPVRKCAIFSYQVAPTYAVLTYVRDSHFMNHSGVQAMDLMRCNRTRVSEEGARAREEGWCVTERARTRGCCDSVWLVGVLLPSAGGRTCRCFRLPSSDGRARTNAPEQRTRPVKKRTFTRSRRRAPSLRDRYRLKGLETGLLQFDLAHLPETMVCLPPRPSPLGGFWQLLVVVKRRSSRSSDRERWRGVPTAPAHTHSGLQRALPARDLRPAVALLRRGLQLGARQDRADRAAAVPPAAAAARVVRALPALLLRPSSTKEHETRGSYSAGVWCVNGRRPRRP